MRNLATLAAVVFCALSLLTGTALADTVTVTNTSQLVAAAQGDHPDRRIVVAPGNYGHVWIDGAHGTAGHLLQIVAQDPLNPPVILNPGLEGFQLANSSYVLLDGLIVRGASEEGFHLGFTGTSPPVNPTNHTILRNCRAENIPTSGNTDGFKFDGTNNILVYNCTVTSSGDCGFDHVGCREELIMRSTMTNCGGGGIHPKGGSYNFGFYKNTFNSAGERNLQFGGSSGSVYYHQGNYNNPGYEAYDQVAMGNVLTGGWSSVAFTSSWHCDFKYNTLVDPTNYVMRILKDGGLNNTAYNVFARNIVKATCNTQNVGSNTNPASFTYADNFWSQAPSWYPGCSETGTVVGNPQLDADLRPQNPAARDYGANAPALESVWAGYTGRFAWAWQQAQGFEPAAKPGGSYRLGPGGGITLDGTASTAGASSYGPYTIAAYDWDTDNDGLYDDASGSMALLTYAAAAGLGAGPHNLALRVRVTNELGNPVTDETFTTLTVVTTPAMAGDADWSGNVDFADYQKLETNFGRTSGVYWNHGDFDGDGDVDFADYQKLETNFARSVPEPAALGLLLTGALGFLRRRT